MLTSSYSAIKVQFVFNSVGLCYLILLFTAANSPLYAWQSPGGSLPVLVWHDDSCLAEQSQATVDWEFRPISQRREATENDEPMGDDDG